MEGVDAAKRFEPCFLCEIFCGFSVFDTSQDVGIDVRLVFEDEWVERLAVSLLGARDELFFVKSKQFCVFLSFYQECCIEREGSLLS